MFLINNQNKNDEVVISTYKFGSTTQQFKYFGYL